jgi:nitrite reductase/ring-hydroxylating ferredoxin subunit
LLSCELVTFDLSKVNICSLDKGVLHEYTVMAPCHGWKLDVRNGQFVENKVISLQSYRCKIENEKIYVEAADGRSLTS